VITASCDAQSLHDRFKRGEIGPDNFRAEQSAKSHKRATAKKRVIDVAAFLESHHITANDTKAETNFTRYSITCPGCGVNNAYIMQHHDGGVSMGCYHASCPFSNKQDHWNDFAKLYQSSLPVLTTASIGELTHPSPEPSVVPDLLWEYAPGQRYAPGDVGNGQRFLAMYRDHVRCDDRRGRVWHWWDGKRWQEVSDGVIRELAHQVGLEYVKQAVEWRSDNRDKEVAKAEEESVRKRAMAYLTTKGLNNAVTEAIPYVLARIDDFDTKRWLAQLHERHARP
jgi:hypothetical protein